jgi:hypothetical protein
VNHLRPQIALFPVHQLGTEENQSMLELQTIMKLNYEHP